MHQLINLGINFAEAVNFGTHQSNFTKIVLGNVTQGRVNPSLADFDAVDIPYRLNVSGAVGSMVCRHCNEQFLNPAFYADHVAREHHGTLIDNTFHISPSNKSPYSSSR